MTFTRNLYCSGTSACRSIQPYPRIACAVLVLLVLSACAGPDRINSFADQFFENVPGAGHINLISPTRSNDTLEITSYGRARGDIEHLVETSSLAERWRIESSWGTVTLSTIPDETVIIEDILSSDETGVSEYLRLVDVAMEGALSSLPGISAHGVNIQVLLTLSNSGFAIQQHHVIDGDPIALSFLQVVFESQEESSTRVFAMLLDTVTHELLHVEHHINDLELDPINYETAASLFGLCSMSRFMIARGEAFELEFELAADTPGFPGIEDGIFNPQVEQFPSEQATLRGENMLGGWTYVYANGKPLDIADPEAMDRMLRLCDRLAVHVPDFVNGETGLESLE